MMDGWGATLSGVGVGSSEGGEGIQVKVVSGTVDGGFS